VSIQCGIGAIAALVALWIAYRSRGRDADLLPPPDPSCQRGTVESVP
jgi:hypothetical protein